MFKKLFGISLIVASLLPNSLQSKKIDRQQLEQMEIDAHFLKVSEALQPLRVFHSKNGFTIEKDGRLFQNCLVDKKIRNITNEQLYHFLGILQKIKFGDKTMLVIKIPKEKIEKITCQLNISENQYNTGFIELAEKISSEARLVIKQWPNGQYEIEAKEGLPGGGILGAIIAAPSFGFIGGITGACIGGFACDGGIVQAFCTGLATGCICALAGCITGLIFLPF